MSSYAVERGGTLELEQGAGQRRRTIKSYGCAAQRSESLTASVTRLPVGSDRLPIMADDLTESIVRQPVRDHAGGVHCGRCLARVLNLDRSVSKAAVVALAARRSPVAVPLCGCGQSRAQVPIALAGPWCSPASLTSDAARCRRSPRRLAQLAAYQREFAAGLADKARREWLRWQIRWVQKRMVEIERRLAES